MLKMLADGRMALMLWMIIAGQSAYRVYSPGNILGPAMLGACLPATLLVGIGHLIARTQAKKEVPPANAEAETPQTKKMVTITYLVMYLVILVAGGFMFANKHASMVSSVNTTGENSSLQ